MAAALRVQQLTRLIIVTRRLNPNAAIVGRQPSTYGLFKGWIGNVCTVWREWGSPCMYRVATPPVFSVVPRYTLVLAK
ncbi:hypothetical protein D3C79_849170 [compost metagenome]